MRHIPLKYGNEIWRDLNLVAVLSKDGQARDSKQDALSRARH